MKLLAFLQIIFAHLADLLRVPIAVVTQTRHPAKLLHWNLLVTILAFFLAHLVACVAQPRCPNLVLWNCFLASCASAVAVSVASITKSRKRIPPGYPTMAAPTPVVAVVADSCAPAQLFQADACLAEPALFLLVIVTVITQTSTPAHLSQRDCLLAVCTFLFARIVAAVTKSRLEPNLSHPELLCTAPTLRQI